MLPKTTRCDVLRALQVEMNTVSTLINTATSSTIPVFYDNVVSTPPEDEVYINFNITFSGNGQRLDGNTYEQSGIAVAQVLAPVGTGLNKSAQVSDIIEDSFRNLKWPDDVLRVPVTTIADIGPDGSSHITNVNIYFEYNK